MTQPVPSTLCVRLTRWYLSALVFLLPLKFGTVVCVGEIGFFPLDIWEWLLTPWPPFLCPVLAGIGLGLAAWSFRGTPLRSPWGAVVPLIWFALLIGALFGLIRTTEWDYALLFCWHLLGALCLVTAGTITMSCDPEFKRWLLGALLAGVVWSMISGWHQVVGGGYEQTLAYAEQMAESRGGALAPQLASRLNQGRASGPFVYPNSFAAHVILVGPLVVLLLWRLASRFEPVRISRALFLTVGVVLSTGAVLLSGSRAGMIALGGGVGVACLGHRRLRAFRVPALVACAAFLALGLGLINRGRTSSSLGARLGYWTSGWRMFVEQPLTGVGLGEFFPHYIRSKGPDAETTRIPHNVAVLFASQAGIAGGFTVLGLLALPLGLPWLARRWGEGGDGDAALLFAVQAGVGAWTLHALADFNMQISGTVATAAILPLVLMPPRTGTLPAWRFQGAVRVGLTVMAAVAVSTIWRWPGERHYQQLYLYQRLPQAQIATLQKLAETTAAELPFSPYPWLLFGRNAEARGLYVLAARGYQETLIRTPHRGSIWYALARVNGQLGRFEEARQALQNGIRWAPHDPQREPLESHLQALTSAPSH